jgi:hypothetical protein
MIKRSLNFIFTNHFWFLGATLLIVTCYFIVKLVGFWFFPYLNYFLICSGSLLLFTLTLFIKDKPKLLIYLLYSFCATSMAINAFVTSSAESFSNYNGLSLFPIYGYLFVLLAHFSLRKNYQRKKLLLLFLAVIFTCFVINLLITSPIIKLLFGINCVIFLVLFFTARNQSADEGSITDNS